MGLQEYRRKRDFEKTAEPRGKPAKPARERWSFVVQKHAARRLHYDFRLELDGVLLSWAVPKGPSLDPSVKRLAVQTEDHPLEYGDFEGTIPKGQYGAGAVIVWDRGRWQPEEDPREGLEKGHLVFRLEGERLRGRWHLVRTRGKGRDADKSWLLFKSKDRAAAKNGQDVVERFQESVVTGRSIEDVARDPDRHWRSDGSNDHPMIDPSSLEGAREERRPRFVKPELATLVDAPPEGSDWIHELKLDGYRILALLAGGKSKLYTRRGNDWTDRFPSLARALEAMPIERALLDGEVVVLDDRGVSKFQKLQNALSDGGDRDVTYFVFDLLHLNGYDLKGVALTERKRLLAGLLEQADPNSARIRLSDHIAGSGADVLARACELGLEGVVSKRADAHYESARTRDWLKAKCALRQEFVIGGFTDPSGSRSRFGALLVGSYEDGGKLTFRGKVGTGFSEQSLVELHDRMRELEQDDAPFENPPRGAEARRAHWIRPELLAEVAYAEITSDGRLRHPRFMGLREDKSPKRVGLETRARPRLRLTNPDRVLYPEQGITKRQIAEYYGKVAEWIVPHVADRPLTLVRCPDGREGECFYQKHAFKGLPETVRSVSIEEENGKIGKYMAIDDAEGVLTLVQFGVLEIHVSGARASDPERPDRLVFDLDPDPELPWERVTEAARTVRERLESLGLESWLKTTGGKGLHVVVPVDPVLEFDAAKAFCKAVADDLVRREPKKYVAVMSKAQRRGKVFIDYLRNSRGATAIAAFSTRARPGAPVAVPLAWDELGASVRSDHYTVGNLARRLAALKRDPWAGFFDVKQRIDRSTLRKIAST